MTGSYIERVLAVKGDSTGEGDMPMEVLQSNTSLPVGTESHVKFTLQSRNDLYTNFDNALFRDEGDPLRFSHPADHPLAGEFEDEMTALIREYKGEGEYLSLYHPDEQGAKDDARLDEPCDASGGGRRDRGYFFPLERIHHHASFAGQNRIDPSG